jgi:hypothetical protein
VWSLALVGLLILAQPCGSAVFRLEANVEELFFGSRARLALRLAVLAAKCVKTDFGQIVMPVTTVLQRLCG